MGATLRALKKSKAAALLIVIEVALTLALVVIALSVVSERMQNMGRPSGVDEARIVSFSSSPIDPKTYAPEAAFVADRERLLLIDGIESVYVTNSLPLSGGGWSTGVTAVAGKDQDLGAAIYMFDENAVGTLGLNIVAGRNFTADEISHRQDGARLTAKVAIITEALAKRLFPEQSAVGKFVSLDSDLPTLDTQIVGVVERLQAPWTGWGELEHTIMVPVRPADGSWRWVLRVQPDALERVLKDAKETLAAADRTRVIGRFQQTGLDLRKKAYSQDRSMALILGTISILLLIITALGIVGMASFWVTQRTKQIGIRRALGARRADILREFHLENALLTGAGAVLGVLIAYGLNFLVSAENGMQPVPISFLLGGVVGAMILGQLAVYWPARRASQVAPAIATRSV